MMRVVWVWLLVVSLRCEWGQGCRLHVWNPDVVASSPAARVMLRVEGGRVMGWQEAAPGISLVEGVVLWEVGSLPPRCGWEVTFEVEGCGSALARAEAGGVFGQAQDVVWCRTFLPIVR